VQQATVAIYSVDLRVKLISGSWELIANLSCDKENAVKSKDICISWTFMFVKAHKHPNFVI
jgi:hypothetical protein